MPADGWPEEDRYSYEQRQEYDNCLEWHDVPDDVYYQITRALFGVFIGITI